MRTRRVITIYPQHRAGGHCKRLYMLMQALLERGYEVHYVAADYLALEEHPNLKPHLVKLPTRRRSGPIFWIWFSVLGPWCLLFQTLTKRFRAISVFETYFALLAAPASVLSATPIYISLRAIPWRVRLTSRRSALGRFLYVFDYLALRLSRKVIAVTETMKSDVMTRIPALKNRIVTLPNSVIYPAELSPDEGNRVSDKVIARWMRDQPQRKSELCEYYGLSEKSLLLTTSGELTPRKNIELVVRAIGACHSNKISLIICGSGPQQSKIHSLAVGLGLMDRLIFAGWLSDPSNIVSGSDLFVMPSKHEGMSNSMLEAMGLCVPIFAADTPEMREVLKHDELIFDGTHVGKLADRLAAMTKDRSIVKQMANLSALRAAEFSFNWGQRVVEIFDTGQPKQSSQQSKSE